MNVLIVGAGAVGQVYGRHLGLGGASVSLFVKEKYAAQAREGYTVYPLNERRDRTPVRWSEYDVVTTAAEVADRSWDQVWLCVSATALAGDWLGELLAAVGDATVVSLQPGVDAQARVRAAVKPDQVVSGMIGFISWQAPLPGETVEPAGIMYWFPPLSPSPFSGPKDRLSPLLEALHTGGCPARKTDDAVATAVGPTAMMMSILVGLEGEDWSFRKLRKSATIRRSCEASRQALTIVGKQSGRKQRLFRLASSPWLMKTVLWLAPHVAPFQLEIYIRYHFTKVGDQTRLLMGEYLAEGRARDLPVDAIETLCRSTWGSLPDAGLEAP